MSRYLYLIFFAISFIAYGQHDITIIASLNTQTNSLQIQQEVVFTNTTGTALSEIYFNDWANSFSSKTTPLAKRFAENYDASFHFEKNEKRGNTQIKKITNTQGDLLSWERGEEVDILKIKLKKPLLPNENFTLNFDYTVTVPDDKFTRYGVTKDGNYKLKYWYLSPAVFTDKWQIYSNKNTDDLFATPSNFKITLNINPEFSVTTDFDTVAEKISETTKLITLEGKQRSKAIIHLEKNNTFKTISTDKLDVITNLDDEKVNPPIRALVVDRVVHFLNEKLGDYPHKTLLVSKADYKSSPVYGLNQLPSFISPFPDGFEYDIEQLKTITRNYIENTLHLHPREDYWLTGALQIYLMKEYVDTYYPKMKIIGNLSDFWIIRWAHAADLEFNDQYPLLYLNMARNNLHQSLTTPKDSLVKFNKQIASDYYAGNGFSYLADYIGKESLLKTIKEFYSENNNRFVTSKKFQEKLESNTNLPINWFFEEYVSKRNIIDFKIKKVEEVGDSLKVTIRDKQHTKMPVSLYGLNKKEIVFKNWIAPIDSIVTVTIPKKDIKRLALNYEASIPEFNQRNNYKSVKGLFNRPLQFRLFQDVEDPKYNQLFFMPIFEYNLYDGFTTGVKLYNKTVLTKGLNYKIEPQYGLRSNTIIGSGSISFTQQFRNQNKKHYATRYGVSGSYYSYNVDLFYKRISPYITFAFRPENDLRNNEKQFINLRAVNVFRDEDPLDLDAEPNYSVFNFQYVYSNPNLINYFRGVVDYQISSKFSKLSTTFEYRKLFLSNRQLNIRAFAGVFLFNDTRPNDDFFSFALDRPTDYLFDYNYYGRSEDTGLFSQQLIVAEGGFKSKLEPAFANSWITTINTSTSIWRWIFAYGDAGLVHNTGLGTQAVFDTGIRLNLVEDYFELYFPLYSNLGWEPGLPNYDQRIRFIVTLSPSTLLKLFTREWY